MTDLAAVPRAAGLLGSALHVPSGEIHADAVRKHVLQRVSRGDASAACQAVIVVVVREGGGGGVGGGGIGDGDYFMEVIGLVMLESLLWACGRGLHRE